MDNTNTKTNSETKTQKDNLTVNNLRDPNIILPQSRRSMKPVGTSGPLDMQTKTDPVMLRSFNKDISEAMAKKKSSVSIKDVKIPKAPKDQERSQPPTPPKAPSAPTISFLKKPVGSTDPKKVLAPQKTADEIKIKTKPIPSAPTPESVVVKKEEVHIPQTPKTPEAKLQFNNKKQGKGEREDFLSEIFPKPPQITQTGEQKFIKKVALSQQKRGVTDQDVQKNQKLRDDFDRMIHGEHDNNQSVSQVEKISETTVKKTLPQQEEEIEKEIKPALSKAVINIHISANDLKKLKEEILNIETEEKELQSKSQDVTKEEITLTEEENKEEAEKNLARKQLDDVLQQEKEIESMIREIEQQEKEARGADERHNIETKRWAQEEKRVQIEKNKWDIGEKYEKLTTSLREKKVKLEQIKSSKDNIGKKIITLLKKKKGKETEVHLGEMERKKEEIENIQMTLLEEKKGFDKTLALLKENKQKVIEERIIAEENEKRVEAMSEKRIFEEKRQNMEIRQRSIEQQRWEAEQKLEQIIKKIKNTNEQYKVTTSMEEEIRKKLQ